MFKWNKLGRVFDPTTVKGKPWLEEFAQAPCTLIFDDFVRVYFSCRPHPDEKGQYVSYSAFVDLDRKNLFNIVNIASSPILELGELGTFDEFGTYPVSAIRKGNQVIAYYGGWTRCESIPFTVSIGIAYSDDNGTTFRKYGKGPLLTSNLHDPFVLSGPKIRKFNDKYYLWYVAVTEWLPGERPDAVYKIRMATSDNGFDWNRNGTNIISDKIETNECQASPDVFFYDGMYHMFFCYKYSLDFRCNDRGYRIGYAWSDNLADWTRDDVQAGIGLSPQGWDDQSIAYPHVFELDGKVYMLYIGNQVGRYGFGIAELELYQKP